MHHQHRNRAFTLIELLIVVAIIAILAAIAVPNFLEAQTRSKVSRARADLRTLATGLESYRIDFNAYPKGNPFNLSMRRDFDPPEHMVLERLSTPVSYITTGLLPDPFPAKARSGVPNPQTGANANPPPPLNPQELEWERYFKYMAGLPGDTGAVSALWTNPGDRAIYYYVIYSSGPDLVRTQLAGTGLLGSSATVEATLNNIYDPTNGTVSTGSLWRVGGEGTGEGRPGHNFFRAIQMSQ